MQTHVNDIVIPPQGPPSIQKLRAHTAPLLGARQLTAPSDLKYRLRSAVWLHANSERWPASNPSPAGRDGALSMCRSHARHLERARLGHPVSLEFRSLDNLHAPLMQHRCASSTVAPRGTAVPLAD